MKLGLKDIFNQIKSHAAILILILFFMILDTYEIFFNTLLFPDTSSLNAEDGFNPFSGLFIIRFLFLICFFCGYFFVKVLKFQNLKIETNNKNIFLMSIVLDIFLFILFFKSILPVSQNFMWNLSFKAELSRHSDTYKICQTQNEPLKNNDYNFCKWGKNAGGYNIGIIYDNSDNFGKIVSQRSQDWRKVAESKIHVSDGPGKLIKDHFYYLAFKAF